LFCSLLWLVSSEFHHSRREAWCLLIVGCLFFRLYLLILGLFFDDFYSWLRLCLCLLVAFDHKRLLLLVVFLLNLLFVLKFGKLGNGTCSFLYLFG